MKRRELLASGGAAGAAVGTVTIGTGAARATSDPDLDGYDFDHVTIEYDEELLKTFQPKVRMHPDSVRKFQWVLAYVARSEEYETTACYYIFRHTHQTGVAGEDSHLGNTSPIIVFIDEDADSDDNPIDEIVWTGWHWNAAAVSGSLAPLVATRDGRETHITLQAVHPWNHYVQNFDETSDGAFFDLKNWFDRRDWLIETNGLYERGEPEAFEEPWTFHSSEAPAEPRAGWWADNGYVIWEERETAVGTFTIPIFDHDYFSMRVWRRMGLNQAGWDDRSDELR